MSGQKRICFKHRCLADNCKCNSPLQITLGYKTRIPQKDRLNGWKKFIDYLNNNIVAYNAYYKTNAELIDKEKITQSWK